MVSLQQTLVLPLLPELPRLLGTTADNASWLVTATLLTGAVATPTISRLADMFGKKRMMMVALLATVAGSLLGAFSETLTPIIVARALQGVGIALVPVGIAIMRDELPQEKAPLGVALMSATLAIGAGAGLPMSGLLAERWDWHVTFWVTAGAGVSLLAAVALVVPESRVRSCGSFDWRGAVLLSAGLTAVLLALSKGGHWGSTSPATLALVTVGAVLIAMWVPVELHVGNPLVDLRVAARPAVLLVNVASVMIGFSMFVNLLVTTQMLQAPAVSEYGFGLGVQTTGLWMVPSALVFGVMAPACAVVTSRYGALTTLVSGALVMAVSYGARIVYSDTLGQVVTGSVLVGIGTALCYAAMPILIMGAVPVTETASANGLNTLLRTVGTSASSATMAAVSTIGLVRAGEEVFPSLGSLTLMFGLAGGLSLLSVALVLPIRRLGGDLDEPAVRPERRHDAVVHGRVVDEAGRPVRNAVVTLLAGSGEQIDWNQVDSVGDYSLAVPGPGSYVLVAAAEGWQARSVTVDVIAGEAVEPVVLFERLTISGKVVGSASCQDAVVVLTRHAGGVVCAATCAVDGSYEISLPANGRYVLTAVAWGATVTRGVAIWGEARVVDLQLPSLEERQRR